jgi:hypothetical protein
MSPAEESDGAAYAAIIDDEGGFTIANLAPGTYRLEVGCVGLLDARYGGGSPENVSAELRLSGGDRMAGMEINLD